MQKIVLVVALALVAVSAFADGSMKPGLWEMRVVKQIIDGQDMAAQMAAAAAQMQQMRANMSPAQRKQMEQMMGGNQPMPGPGNVQRICVSPAMAKEVKPVMPEDARCAPSNVTRSGNKVSFELKCPNMTGKGESIVSGNAVTTRLDAVMTESGKRHTMQSEWQMRYLGSDCQGVKPADEMAREMQRGYKK